jgi:metal-responsive CopG/Arc/MetJ family transcriptional regulator
MSIVRLSNTQEALNMGRTTKTLTVSLPPEIFDEIANLAKLERKTKSELFRDMVRVYEDQLDEARWKKLRRLGKATAKKYRLTTAEDIEKLIHEARGGRT